MASSLTQKETAATVQNEKATGMLLRSSSRKSRSGLIVSKTSTTTNIKNKLKAQPKPKHTKNKLKTRPKHKLLTGRVVVYSEGKQRKTPNVVSGLNQVRIEVEGRPETFVIVPPSDKACTFKEACAKHNVGYRQGNGYYAVSRTETIHELKNMLLEDSGTGTFVATGCQPVRKLLGWPLSQRLRKGPGDIPRNHRLFVQSTSPNRKIPAGVAVLVKVQYNQCAGRNVITEAVAETVVENGTSKTRTLEKQVATDSCGNADGNQYDLAIDGAFAGRTIAVLDIYGISFDQAEAALKEKGFKVHMSRAVPAPKALKEILEKSCQLWIISGQYQHLADGHLEVIKDFFDLGRGLYIWGDNKPYYADANYVSRALVGWTMEGNEPGQKVVGLQTSSNNNSVGLAPNHLISTGLQHIYEGHTIATIVGSPIRSGESLAPILKGSAENLVAASYEYHGKRLLIDGGFTRLYCNWDSAGTGRYVKNAAAWLVNQERCDEEQAAMIEEDSDDDEDDQADR